jgi:hypothetical protein
VRLDLGEHVLEHDIHIYDPDFKIFSNPTDDLPPLFMYVDWKFGNNTPI